MALRNCFRTYDVTPKQLENSDLLKLARKSMGEEFYLQVLGAFHVFIKSRTKENSGGYFLYASLMNGCDTAPKSEMDKIWQKMEELYGDDEDAHNYINRVLGTICMLCAAMDDRPWYFKDDPDKQEKLSRDEIPSANEYFLGDYIIERAEPKVTEIDRFKHKQQLIEKLKEKFNR